MTARLDAITQQRLDKLETLRARGINPYPNRFHRTHTTREAINLLGNTEHGQTAATSNALSVSGRITAWRDMGKVVFFDLKDGEGKIQVYCRANQLGDENFQLLKLFDIGDFAGVEGHPFRTRTGEPSIQATRIEMLCKALLPLPEKWHGLTDPEKRYRQRYLDLISSEEIKLLFETRCKVISEVRRFMDNKGYLEVETPVLQPHAGGATAKPFITHYEALDQDFYLRIALELYHKRLIIGGFDKIYEIGRIFRNEGISTRHNPEFTMMESYEAYADYMVILKLVEELFSSAAQNVLGTMQVTYEDNIIDFTPPWKQIPLRQAVIDYCGIDFEQYPDTDSLRSKMMSDGMTVDPKKGRGKLIDELISTFVEPNLIQPTFLIDYPVDLSPLAKRKPGSTTMVERFEAFAGKIEVANAFTELNDPIDQRERFQQQKREHEQGDEEATLPDEDFLTALEHGMPPTGGLGVGIDRMIMLFTNRQSIREIILFPQLRSKG